MYSAIAANKRNTVFIMVGFIVLIGLVGWVVSYFMGDTSIAYIVLVVAVVYAIIQYYAGTSLATMSTGAHEIEKKDNPRLYRIVENLSITLGMPMPKVYLINDPAPNAFATGRNPQHAVVAATTGLMEIMDDRELEAVMAHEMGHVKNYDIRVSMIAFALVAAIAFLTDVVSHALIFGGRRDSNSSPLTLIIGLVIIILAPLIAILIQAAISRQREYLADASGAMTTRDPDGLASALGKLKEYGRPMKRQNSAAAHLFISDPLKPGFVSRLFSTHPPLEDRIARLQKNAGKF